VWKVIYVASHPDRLRRLTRALDEAGLAWRTRRVGGAQAGGDEVMVLEGELAEAQAVLARVIAEDAGPKR
jgi:hypothetical protein